MVDPSSQLQSELEDSIKNALAAHRPILFHVNADTTWLLSLPYPDDAVRPPRRCRFNILIDPWLQGPQNDVAGWFSTQWHSIRSSVQTIHELNELLCDREALELNALERGSRAISEHSRPPTSASGSYVDAVVCSHEFTDHCHRETLEEIDPSVPCIATTEAAKLIRSWEHFRQVLDVPPFVKGADWRKYSASALPSWIGIARLVTDTDAFYFHSAVAIFCRDTQSIHPDAAEAVIYTPHGINPEDGSPILAAVPPVRTLALLHGLHDVSITFTKRLNLGAHNALRCQRILNSKYWVGTHDEVKVAAGLIAPFLRRRAYTLEDALKAQEQEQKIAGIPAAETNYVELASGETLLLE